MFQIIFFRMRTLRLGVFVLLLVALFGLGESKPVKKGKHFIT